jgi:6-phosphofructokinase
LPLRELELTHERTREPVAYIHKRGGTILGSSREFEAFSY